MLVPYKRHESASIEAILSPDVSTVEPVSADESTLCRWKQWFQEMAAHWVGSLRSIAEKLGHWPVEESVSVSSSPLQTLFLYVGSEPGWLAQIVRAVVNSQLWLSTRSAWMTKKAWHTLMLNPKTRRSSA